MVFQKGNKSWNKGMPKEMQPFYRKNHKEESRRKIGRKEEKNSGWKGDDAGKIAIHAWVHRYKPKPDVCENCKTNKPYDAANISGLYKRDVNDFRWLCRSCHMKEDGRIIKLYENAHKNLDLRPRDISGRWISQQKGEKQFKKNKDKFISW